jgi:predicted dehydrogenase
MRRLRVGLIGLGLVAEAHLEGYKLVDKIEVVAGAEIKEDRLRQMAKKWGFKGYSNYEEMLDKENLDIACILTPARYHREITETAAECGIHILCEKPMAVTLEDALAMRNKCKKEGIMFCYGASYRYLCACRRAKEMIEDGHLGNLSLLIETFVGGNGLKNFRDMGPQHYPEGGPGGGGMGLMDHGIHLIDMFMWMTGSEVKYVIGRGNYSGKKPKTEFLTMIFNQGIIGQLVYNEATYSSDLPYEGIFSWGGSWDIHYNLILGGGWEAHPGNFRVHGEKGALRVFHYANKLFYRGEGELEQIRVDEHPMPGNFSLQMESFATKIIQRKEPEVTSLDGLKALQVALAAYESFEKKKVVPIKPID